MAVVGVLAVTGGASCVRNINRPPVPADAKLEDVLQVVEFQTSQLQSVEMPEGRLTVKYGSIPPISLAADLAAQRPRRLRLVASFFGINQVDLGSNPTLFWFWVKNNTPAGVFYAEHDRYAQSPLRQQLPIDPTWLMESLGVGLFRPGDQHISMRPREPGMLEIRTLRPTVSGLVQKFTRVDRNMGWVVEQYLIDEKGQLLAAAQARGHQTDPYTGAVIPQQVALHWPAADLRLKMDFPKIQFNGSFKDRPELWTMPTIPGFPQRDLTKYQLKFEGQ